MEVTRRDAVKRHHETSYKMVLSKEEVANAVALHVRELLDSGGTDVPSNTFIKEMDVSKATIVFDELYSGEVDDSGCEYCTGSWKMSAGVCQWKAVDGIYEATIDVKFCPNCGKELGQ